LYVALAATALALAWQAATAKYNYGGDWTAFFHTAAYFQMPAALQTETVYRFPGQDAYDGQFYHLIAHDPWLRGGSQPFVDNPQLRWRRILAPAAAWLAAGGDGERVDNAYFAVTLMWVFLGAWWLARLAPHPAWGFAFLLLPATLVSLDRMTVDVALAALCVGFALFEDQPRKLFAVLALAPLARETGVVLIGAACLAKRSWKPGLALAPFAAWTAYVHAVTAGDQTRWLSWPLAGIVTRTLHPMPASAATSWVRTAAALDLVALAGVWLAFVLTARAAWRRETTSLHLAAYGFAALAALLGKADIWTDAYSFARTQTPLLLCLALTRGSGAAIPTALALPRLFFQLGPQWLGILRGLLR
jgi:hypothetical protein